MPRQVVTLCILSALLGACGPAFGMEPQWPAKPYKYLVIDQDVKSVLTEFGRNIGVAVDVSDQVKGRMRGRLTVTTAREFLDGVCESYDLVWYFDGAVLHVSAKAEVKTELLNIGRLSPAEVNDKLNALGVTDARFSVRSTHDNGVVSVSGPPPFVSLVRQTLSTLARQASPPVREESPGDDVRVRVFRGGASVALPKLSLADSHKP